MTPAEGILLEVALEAARQGEAEEQKEVASQEVLGADLELLWELQ